MNGDVLALGNAISQALAKVFASDAIRRSSPVSALLVASPVALLIGLLAAALLRAPVSLTSVGWGALAGLVGGVGLVFNFRALAVGTVAVVIPVMTCASTTLQVGASWVIEGRPELGTLVGAVLCVLAVGVISWRTEDDLDREHIRQTVGYAIAAGACFAGFGVIINHGAGGSSLWAVVGARVGVLGIVLLLALIGRTTLPPDRRAKGLAALSGAFDVAANVLFVEALAAATLALVSVIAALTPVFAALLAFAFLGQRPSRRQVIGLSIALVGVLLVIFR